MPTNNKKNNTSFYSKILLFGEYSIILGSMGLTIPYAHFNGSLEFYNSLKYTNLDFAKKSNLLLKEYLVYLHKLKNNNQIPFSFNLGLFEKDLEKGLYFESSIPEGYGLGSSGALVAALYHKYKTNKVDNKYSNSPNDLLKLKNELSILESWFHGTSSGIDPLVCYIKRPLLLKEDHSIETIGIPRYNLTPEDAIFLIDSGKSGKTAPLVEQFMKNCEDNSYLKLMKNEYIPLNNKCIKDLIAGDIDKFTKSLKALSLFQYEHFKSMIPASLDMEWLYGITTEEYLLKLCGSGGDGFIIGFTKNYNKVKKRFNNKNMEIIPVYQR